MEDLDLLKELLPKFADIENESFVETSEDLFEPTPMYEENKKINTGIGWEKAYHELILEILDFDLGLVKAKTSFTNALLNAGVQYNPQQVYQVMELIATRLERIHIVKRMCNFIGLQNEMDKIIEHEMELIYRTPQYNRLKNVDLTNPVAGETR